MPSVLWPIQMVGVSVAFPSNELVPSVDLCTVVDTNSGVSVSPAPL